MSHLNSKKPYNPALCNMGEFYIPHAEANHLNAQDVVYSLLTSARDISVATFNCFDEGNKLMIKDEIVANLIHEIQTKLEMIEKILPMAFDDETQAHEQA